MQTRWNFEIYLCTLVLNNIKQQEDPRKLRAVSRKSQHKRCISEESKVENVLDRKKTMRNDS